MGCAKNKIAVLGEYLSELGLPEEELERLTQLAEEKQFETISKSLSAFRNELNNHIRAERKRLDCLDFVIYQLDKGAYE
ncbi:MAG: hypothetical protein Q4F15_01290 [Bacillota bacterium]|nr:hypothetical protein [Bacillota bacterium]